MKAKFAEFGPLFSRKFDESSPPRIFVESNEISLPSCRNVASTEAKFRSAEISPEIKLALAKWQGKISLAMEANTDGL